MSPMCDDMGEMKKKLRLQQDILSIELSADALLVKAEAPRSVMYVIEANSLHRSSKQKTEELETRTAAGQSAVAVTE